MVGIWVERGAEISSCLDLGLKREGLRAAVIWSRSRWRNLLLQLLPTPTTSIISRDNLQWQVGLDLKKTMGNILVFGFFGWFDNFWILLFFLGLRKLGVLVCFYYGHLTRSSLMIHFLSQNSTNLDFLCLFLKKIYGF